MANPVVIDLTTGGAPLYICIKVDERVRPAERFKPEVASLNGGSMDFGLFPMLNRLTAAGNMTAEACQAATAIFAIARYMMRKRIL
jgi:beta-keto acid cleavage enzyme